MRRASDPANLSDGLRLLLTRLPLERRTRILDVGANPLHEAPYAGLLAAGGCDVVGFEPQADAFAKLDAAKGPHETYLPFAVGDGTERTLHLYRRTGFTSVHKPDKAANAALGTLPWTRISRTEPMPTVAIDRDDRVGPFDLMKIDIQGGEVDVFRGAETALKAATAVIAELRYFPIYRDEPMAGGVDSELRRQGFILHRFLFTKSRMIANSQGPRLRDRKVSDQAIDGDAVYIRRLERLPDCDAGALMHLCVLAAGVFHSHSLVLHVLDLLVARAAVGADLPGAYVDLLPPELRAAP